jgi:hypothetical protein
VKAKPEAETVVYRMEDIAACRLGYPNLGRVGSWYLNVDRLQTWCGTTSMEDSLWL